MNENILKQQQSNLTSQLTSQIQHNYPGQQLSPFQKLIDKVGGQNRYQFISFLIFCALWFLTGLTLTGQGFFFDNSYECYHIEDKQLCQEFICKLSEKDRPLAIKSHSNSMIFAFEETYFICQYDYYVTIFQSLVYAGSLIGFFIIPYVADNWGRKVAIIISWAIYSAGLTCLALSNSGNMIAVGQFLSGFGCNPAVTLCYSFLNQQCLGKKRQRYSVAIQLALAVGQCLIALLFLPPWSWRSIFFSMLGLNVLIFITLFYLVESPKFLFSKSLQKTLTALNSIAKKNSKPILTLEELKQIRVDSQDSSYSTFDLFKYPSLRWVAVCTGIGFLAIQVIYYGTLLNLDSAGFSKLINQQIIGISQIAGYLAIELVISRINRRKSSIIGLATSGILCLILALLGAFANQNNQQAMKWLETVGLVINRFILCAFWALFYVYIAELYPTKVRSLGFGWASALGTVGSILAPNIIFISQKVGINSWITPGVIGLLASGTLFFLRQTKGMPMLQEIQEVALKGITLSQSDSTNSDKNEDQFNIKT